MNNDAYDASKKLLICTVGLPRSGKSTIVRELSRKFSAPIVERDAIRMALFGRPYEPLAERIVKATSDLMIRSLFISGHDIVVADETHWSHAARDRSKSDKWTTVFIHVDTSASVCKERAVATKQEYLIPVIDEMVARFEAFGPNDTVATWDGNVLMYTANNKMRVLYPLETLLSAAKAK